MSFSIAADAAGPKATSCYGNNTCSGGYFILRQTRQVHHCMIIITDHYRVTYCCARLDLGQLMHLTGAYNLA